MSLAVLSDEDFRGLLESLTPQEAEKLVQTLRCALYDYSSGSQSVETNIHQPKRQTVNSTLSDATTIFVPSYNAKGHGVKVVTSSNSEAERPVRRQGALSLFNPQGQPIAFLHAQTLTAFRTALASSCLLIKRGHVKAITVFGAGLQAYWHIRLALMFRGSTIRHVNIVNRRFSENARTILKKIYAVSPETRMREGWIDAQFDVLTPGYGEFARLLKEHVRSADVIYCCTPSTEPLFDAELLTSHEGRKKGRLIVAIGSYTRDMRELPRELLEQATWSSHDHHGGGHGRHFHRHAVEGGVVVVDTLDGALRDAGEIVDAGLDPRQLVELGELVMIQKAVMIENRIDDNNDDAKVESRTAAFTRKISAQLSSDMEKLRFATTPGKNTSSANNSPALSAVFGSVSGSDNTGASGMITPDEIKSRSVSGSRSPGPTTGFFHHLSRRQSSSQESTVKQQQSIEKEDHLSQWLTSGNIICKIVGLELMDLVVGMEIVKMAREKGVGHHIERFS